MSPKKDREGKALPRAALAPPLTMQALLHVDLQAVVANWRRLGVEHRAPVAGVLKANGYGLGAVEVGRALGVAGCRHFFVAHVAEAVVWLIDGARTVTGELLLLDGGMHLGAAQGIRVPGR